MSTAAEGETEVGGLQEGAPGASELVRTGPGSLAYSLARSAICSPNGFLSTACVHCLLPQSLLVVNEMNGISS